MKTILLTGGAGFVGANLAVFLKEKVKDYRIICFDNLSRSGSQLNLPRLKDAGIKFIRGDVQKKRDVLALPRVDVLLDCCAEPSVLAGYHDPDHMLGTNLLGTLNCLELARRDSAAFIFLSTSRVYPIARLNTLPWVELPTRFDWKKTTKGEGHSYQGICEDFPLNGVRSLYGTTKLCSEQLILEFLAMASFPGVINRLGVIAGPWQMGKIDQGIVGYWILQHLWERKLAYIGFGGEGKQVRDVVHIDDVCDLVLYQLRHLRKLNGEIFNVGGGRKNAGSLKELTRIVQDVTKKKVPIQSDLRNRAGDIRIYITDNRHVQQKTGWFPRKSVVKIVEDTYAWTAQYNEALRRIF